MPPDPARLRATVEHLVAIERGSASVNEYKLPSNYHSPEDTAANLDYATVADATRVSEAAIRSLAR